MPRWRMPNLNAMKIGEDQMPKQRSEYKEAKFDSKHEVYQGGLIGGSSPWENFYIWVLIHSDKSDGQKKSRMPKRLFLPIDCDPTKPPVPLTHYTRTATNRPRQRQVYEPENSRRCSKIQKKIGELCKIGRSR